MSFSLFLFITCAHVCQEVPGITQSLDMNPVVGVLDLQGLWKMNVILRILCDLLLISTAGCPFYFICQITFLRWALR